MKVFLLRTCIGAKQAWAIITKTESKKFLKYLWLEVPRKNVVRVQRLSLIRKNA